MEWIIYNKITDKLFVMYTKRRYAVYKDAYTIYYGSSKTVLTYTQFLKQIACNSDIVYLGEL